MLKIAIFGHEAWNLKKSARSCIWTLFLPQKVEIELIFALRAAVSEIWAHFENAIFGHETRNLQKVPEVAYLPQGVQVELISL